MNLIAVEELLLMGKYARDVIILPEASKASGGGEKGSGVNLEPDFRLVETGGAPLSMLPKLFSITFASGSGTYVEITDDARLRFLR